MNYNPNARPSTGINDAVILHYDVALRQMVDLVWVSCKFTLQIKWLVSIWWFDWLLHWFALQLIWVLHGLNRSRPCVKNVRIRSFFWFVFSCIRTRRNSYLGTFHAVRLSKLFCKKSVFKDSQNSQKTPKNLQLY